MKKLIQWDMFLKQIYFKMLVKNLFMPICNLPEKLLKIRWK